MEIGTTDVADEKRIAGEDEPRLLRPASAVGHDEREMRGCMTRGCERCDDCVPELDHRAVRKRVVGELDTCPSGEIGGRAGGLDEGGQAGHVIRLDMSLEDGGDRGA